MLLGLGLVVFGSLLHALWNLLVKRAGASGTEFAWLYCALVTPVLVALLVLRGDVMGGLAMAGWWAAVVSAGLHLLYAAVLHRSYARADLGVVYPLARAGAPVLVALASVPLLQASITPVLWSGIALIAAGVPLLVATGASPERAGIGGAVAGGATAATIAAYTLWDGYAVSRLHVDVLTYLTVASLSQLLVLTLAVLPRPSQVVAVARSSWHLALPVAVLVPLQHIDVHVVAAARCTSILFAAALGCWILEEPRTIRRAAGASSLTAGVALSALGSETPATH